MTLDPEKRDILDRVRSAPEIGRSLRAVSMNLLAGLDGYDWSGVYRLESDTLVLDAYVGAPTDHDRIPIGRGVCGAAVAERQNKVVEDVSVLSNYLSCSVDTRSEIVVLIRSSSGSILGQIDIDSHQKARFGPQDEAFLEALGNVLAERWDD